MAKITNVGKVVIGAVVAAVVIVLGIAAQNNPGGISPQNAATAPNGTVSALSPAQTPVQPKPRPVAQPPGIPASRVPPKLPNRAFVTPVPGDAWKIGAQNMVSWNREGGISGDIYVIDATTRRFIGVIIPQIGPHQTSYTWNTRDVFLDRTSPAKKDILPGTYILKVAFDGNNLPVITSPALTITN